MQRGARLKALTGSQSGRLARLPELLDVTLPVTNAGESSLRASVNHRRPAPARLSGSEVALQRVNSARPAATTATANRRLTPAQPLEEQLIDWLHDFQPDDALRHLVLDTIQGQAGGHPGEDAERRRELTAQLGRLRDLYVMGDITKPQYTMRRQMPEEELQRAKPPTDPDLDRAQTILEDFTRFWDAEPEPAERRKLILSLFAQVWAKDNQIVAVKPNPVFASYFTTASEVRATHQKPTRGDEATNYGSDGTRTRDLCRDRAAL